VPKRIDFWCVIDEGADPESDPYQRFDTPSLAIEDYLSSYFGEFPESLVLAGYATASVRELAFQVIEKVFSVSRDKTKLSPRDVPSDLLSRVEGAVHELLAYCYRSRVSDDHRDFKDYVLVDCMKIDLDAWVDRNHPEWKEPP
jgi:hypothetical protein